jgi:hypothetical protein
MFEVARTGVGVRMEYAPLEMPSSGLVSGIEVARVGLALYDRLTKRLTRSQFRCLLRRVGYEL